MSEGGRLTICAKRMEMEGREAEAAGVRPGAYVCFSVSDTGHGMDAATAERATEPFFTTKPVGDGTGLGLSTVYGFVSQSGGGMRIQSAPGRGTVINLFLPRASCSDLMGRSSTPTTDIARRARILVAEDDELVRSHLVRLLLGLDYEVAAVENGPEALHLLSVDDGFDLLLTDIVMPGGMNGRQLSEHAKLLHPTLRVLFTTGYADDEILKSGRAYSQDQILRKPFRRTELATKVAKALG